MYIIYISYIYIVYLNNLLCIYVCILVYTLYIYIYISVLPLQSVGRSNFDKGRHNSNNYVDSKSAYN